MSFHVYYPKPRPVVDREWYFCCSREALGKDSQARGKVMGRGEAEAKRQARYALKQQRIEMNLDYGQRARVYVWPVEGSE